MANTLKTVQGEILVSEVEAVSIDTLGNLPLAKAVGKVVLVGKTGIRYDLTGQISLTSAQAIAAAAMNYVAGIGHQVFDPTKPVEAGKATS